MTIYHLPQGQYGYTGHVINMPQDLSVFATSLPRLPFELDVMIVRKKGLSAIKARLGLIFDHFYMQVLVLITGQKRHKRTFV